MLSFCLFCCGKKKYRFVACFTTEKEVYSVGEEVKFQNCSEYYKKGKSIEGWGKWDFGDGNSANIKHQDPVSHTYNYAGEYTIRLLVGNIEGPNNFIEKSITIIE